MELSIRDKIINAASDDFARYGYRSVRTDDLARKIGVSKRTLYENFSSKEKLFLSVIENTMDKIKKRADEIVLKFFNGDDVDFWESMLEMMRLNLETSRVFTREFFMDIQSSVPLAWEKIKNFRECEMRDYFIQIYEYGVKKGVFKKDFNQELLYLIHYHVFNRLLSPELISELPLTTSDVIISIYDVLFTGILTEQSNEHYMNQIRNKLLTTG